MLQWIDDRWHCEGRGIHAGDRLELLEGDDAWREVRVESQDGGRVLLACSEIDARMCERRIDPERERLRWPRRG